MSNPHPSKPFSATNQPKSNGNRARTPHIKTILEEILKEIDPKSKKALGYKLCRVLVAKGIKGKDVSAIKEVFDRVAGKSIQQVDVAGVVDAPLVVSFAKALKDDANSSK